MATSPVFPENGGSRRALNPDAEAFFPHPTATHVFYVNPNPNYPPLHFNLPPTSLRLPPPPPPPPPFPYPPPPPPTSHWLVLPEEFPSATYGRGGGRRARGRGGRGRNSWRGRGGRRGTRGPGRVSSSDDEGWLSTDITGRQYCGVMDGGNSSAPSYERVVKARRGREIAMMVERMKKPVVPLSEGGHETTVMIRNIPNKYTRELLIKFLDSHCASENLKLESDGIAEGRSAYDFVYLPLDLRRKANLGYAFVNFTDPRAAWRFFQAANGRKWELFYSNKVREVASARLQGKEELVKHFQRTMFACESEDFLPVCFSPPRDGSAADKAVTQTTVGGFTPTSYQ